jgi:BirA family biotin operon repressor/biotin-[acetyl-CoA-carboxylase] ligase
VSRPPPHPSGAAATPPWRLRTHGELPSTQDIVLRAAEAGEPEGLAVLAHRQTAGRGREGRNWDSPPGNLHLSALLRPQGPAGQAAQWALLAAVALADALAPHLPPDAPALALKWPNDVLLGNAKVAGILAEAATGPSGELAWVALGIGVNLAHAPRLPDGRPTVSLAACGVGPPAPDAFAAELLAALDRWRHVRARHGFGPIRAAWLDRGHPLGAPIAVGTVSGHFAGLGEDGSLLLATADGAVHAMVAGEVEAG